MTFKSSWQKLPYPIKGMLISLIILGLIPASLTLLTIIKGEACIPDVQGNSHCSPMSWNVFTGQVFFSVFFIGVTAVFVCPIGALIGWIYGKVKN